MNKKLLEKYGFPLLALILLIILLLCHWNIGDLLTLNPPGEGTPDDGNEPCTWTSIAKQGGVNDYLGNRTERVVFTFNIDDRFDRGDDDYRIEFERWWDTSPFGGCTYPCPDSVRWEVRDSNGQLIFSSNDLYRVNTYDNPDIITGAYNGQQWEVTIINRCACVISEDWEINIYKCI